MPRILALVLTLGILGLGGAPAAAEQPAEQPAAARADAGGWTSAGDGTLRVRIRAPTVRMAVGAPVPATIAIVNEGAAPVTIVLTNDVQLVQPRLLELLGEGRERPVPMTRHGQALRDITEHYRRIAKVLDPGAVHEVALDLARVFDLSRDGRYALETAVAYVQDGRQATVAGPRVAFAIGGAGGRP